MTDSFRASRQAAGQENTGRNRRQGLRSFVFAGLVLIGLALEANAQPLPSPIGEHQRLPLLLRKLDQTHRVLYVTAHPDDEDAALIAELAHGRGAHVTLFTLTRGNGGQNEIGEELFDALAVVRTEELAAAHSYDGADQRFGLADDFGYSFSVEETFTKWGYDAKLAEVVRAIRELQPDVILTLPPGGAGGGQHHQASAQITLDAFDRAADAEYAPELGAPHQTARLFQVLWQRARGKNICSVPCDTVDPILGCSYGELGAQSRAQHKCQGMARVHPPYSVHLAKLDFLKSADGSLRSLDHPLAGLPRALIDSREDPGTKTDFGRQLERRVESIRSRYSATAPERIARPLAELYQWLDTQSGGPRLENLKRVAAEAARHAAGVALTARAPSTFAGQGETIRLTVAARSARIDTALEWNLTLGDQAMTEESLSGDYELTVGERKQTLLTATVNPTAAVTIPIAPFGITPRPVTRWQVEGTFTIGDIEIPVAARPIDVHRVDAAFPTVRRSHLQIVPDPSVRPVRRTRVAPYSSRGEATPTTPIEFWVSSRTPGEVRLDFAADDDGWTIDPPSLVVATPGEGREVRVRCTAVGPRSTSTTQVRATATRGDRTSQRGYRTIDYPHLAKTALGEPATVVVKSFACDTAIGRRLGYVTGTGDRVAEAIIALGHQPTFLGRDDLIDGDLDRFDTIVLGVRAYKVRDDLIAAQPRLLEWVERGGHLVVQYNKFEFNADTRPPTSPYVPHRGAAVASKRVTVEEAPITLTDPTHSFFRVPNHLNDDDWSGWVQERGLYFLETRNDRYQDLITTEDPWPFNPGPKGGALVTTEVGEGRWTYLGLGLFRQLPAGVPGAYRLLANLLD